MKSNIDTLKHKSGAHLGAIEKLISLAIVIKTPMAYLHSICMAEHIF